MPGFLSFVRGPEHERGFCLRCKCRQPFAESPEVRTTKNGKTQHIGNCTQCGARMRAFVPTGEPHREPPTMPSIRVSPEVKQRVVEAAEFGGVTQPDIVAYLVNTGLDMLVDRMGDALSTSGVRLSIRQMTLQTQAQIRLGRRRFDVPRPKPHWRSQLLEKLMREDKDGRPNAGTRELIARIMLGTHSRTGSD